MTAHLHIVGDIDIVHFQVCRWVRAASRISGRDWLAQTIFIGLIFETCETSVLLQNTWSSGCLTAIAPSIFTAAVRARLEQRRHCGQTGANNACINLQR